MFVSQSLYALFVLFHFFILFHFSFLSSFVSHLVSQHFPLLYITVIIISVIQNKSMLIAVKISTLRDPFKPFVLTPEIDWCTEWWNCFGMFCLQVDKIIDQLQQFVQGFDLFGLTNYWLYLDKRLFSRLEDIYRTTVNKLRTSLYRYYVINTIQVTSSEKCVVLKHNNPQRVWFYYFVIPES